MEKSDLDELAEGLFLIQDRGMITSRELFRMDFLGAERLTLKGKETLEKLGKQGIIGSVKDEFDEEENSRIYFDNLDPDLSKISKHPKGIETLYEIKFNAGYSEKYVSTIVKEVLDRYDRLREVAGRGRKEINLLAAAISLTCRGKYQCPTNMKKYFEMAGGLPTVFELGERIGESLRYDPDQRIKSYIPRLREELGFDGKMVGMFLDLWRKERHLAKNVTPVYVAALSHIVMELSGKEKTLKEICKFFGITDMGMRLRIKDIAFRQGLSSKLSIIDKEQTEQLKKLRKQFIRSLGFPHRFEIRGPLIRAYEKQNARLGVVEYLVKNQYYKKNPIDPATICNELGLDKGDVANALSYRKSNYVNAIPFLSPINAGVNYLMGTWSKTLPSTIYVEDIKKASKYVSLMKKLVRISREINIRQTIKNGPTGI